MASQGESSTQNRNANGQFITARDTDGRFVPLGQEPNALMLHERREHDLEQLRVENNELKEKIDYHYASTDSRTRNAGKRKAEDEGDRVTVAADQHNIWEDFAKDVGIF